MKIIFNCVGTKPLFYDKGGAIQKLVSYQVENLKREHQLIVVGQVAKKTKGIKVIYQREKFYDFSLLEFIWKGIRGFLKIRHQEADLIISTHPRNFLASFLYSKFKNKPLIAWELDHIFWVEPETITKKAFHFLVNQADKVIAISRIQRRRMIKKGVRPRKMVVIYDAVDTKKFTPVGKRVSLEKDKYLLSVSKFVERKNQLTLLRAFKKLVSQKRFSNLKLYLVGPISGAFTSPSTRGSAYYHRCRRYIRQAGLEKKVKIYQEISEKRLINLYQQAVVFVFPSLEEGFGMGLLEAMACGCPCLANNIEPLSEILADAGKLVDASRPEVLAKAIENLLLDKQLAEKLAKLARKRAVSKFSHQVIGKQFQDLLVSWQKNESCFFC